jgi:hypothetical protein
MNNPEYQAPKAFWSTRKVTAYCISEYETRLIVDIEYVEPFRDGIAVKRITFDFPK